VNLAVNNAGIDVRGGSLKLPRDRRMEMALLNTPAVVELRCSLLPSTRKHSQARINNASSRGSFKSIPYATRYAATESFVMSFSLEPEEELRSHGVSVVTHFARPDSSQSLAR
jgi:short-subunit dehydrogenase